MAKIKTMHLVIGIIIVLFLLSGEKKEGLQVIFVEDSFVGGDITLGQTKTISVTFQTPGALNDVVIESFIERQGLPGAAIVTVNVDRCALLAGVQQDPHFRNEIVDFPIDPFGPTDVEANFIFTPQQMGVYYVYADALSDCGFRGGEFLMPNQFLGSFEVLGSGCANGNTQPCFISSCTGIRTCSGGVWGDCAKVDPNCGVPSVCGDGTCTGAETSTTCPDDCDDDDSEFPWIWVIAAFGGIIALKMLGGQRSSEK